MWWDEWQALAPYLESLNMPPVGPIKPMADCSSCRQLAREADEAKADYEKTILELNQTIRQLRLNEDLRLDRRQGFDTRLIGE